MDQLFRIDKLLTTNGIASFCLVATVITVVALIVAWIVRRNAPRAYGALLSAQILVAMSPLICWVVPQSFLVPIESKTVSMRTTEASPAIQHLSTNFARQTHSPNSEPPIVESTTAEPATVKPAIVETANIKLGQTPQVPDSRQAIVRFVDNVSEENAAASIAHSTNFSSSEFDIPWQSAAIIIWLFGVVILSLRILLQTISLRRFCQTLKPCTDSTAVGAISRARCCVPGAENVELKVGPVLAPVAMNWPCRQVVIPEKMLGRFERTSLCRILIHELAHVTRRDQWILFFQRTIAAVLWPFAPVHLLNALINRHREDICDNYVLDSNLENAIAFSRDLLAVTNLTDGEFGGSPALATGLVSERRLEKRIAALISPKRVASLRPGYTQMATVFLLLLFGASAVASVGWTMVRKTEHKYFARTAENQSGPLYSSILLSEQKPENLKLAIELPDGKQRFAQIRYGSPSSDRVSIVVVNEPESKEYNLYVDANRDFEIEASERVEGSGKTRECKIDSIGEYDVRSESASTQRRVSFRRGIFADRIGFATIGFVRGPVNLSDDTFEMLRVDGNNNGQFGDLEDRVWIDLDRDGQWEFEEQINLGPIVSIQNNRYRVTTDTQSDDIRIDPIEGTGTLSLAPHFADPKARVLRLRATFVGEDGSAFTIDSSEQIDVPIGIYHLSNLSIAVGATDKSPSQSFVFTRRGSTAKPRPIEVKQDQAIAVDPVGKLTFVAETEPIAKRGDKIRVNLRIKTSDGLVLTLSHTGIPENSLTSGQPRLVDTRMRSANKEIVSGTTSGFY